MEITIRNLQKKIPINPKRIKKAILKVLSLEAKQKSGQITVSFVNDRIIQGLNLKFLHKNMPTDVLAFDLRREKVKGPVIADIIISTDTAVRNAKIFHTPPLYETYLYLVHGVLHLLGYDDNKAQQRKIMEKKSAHILSLLQTHNS